MAYTTRMFLVLCFLTYSNLSISRGEAEKLIGWKGESHLISAGLRGLEDKNVDLDSASWVETISWQPRASLIHNFLTSKECLHLIHKAGPRMAKSSVVDSRTGQSKDSRVRTSSGTFFRRGEDQIIQAIERKIADFTFIPIEHGEGIQVLHYQKGQKYDAHNDYFHDTINIKNGGQRIATVLMYLTDVEEGGETVFPASDADPSNPNWSHLSTCGRSGVSVKPRRGDALLFWSMSPNATLDPKSIHAGCPVIKGNKWSATKWLRVLPYSV